MTIVWGEAPARRTAAAIEEIAGEVDELAVALEPRECFWCKWMGRQHEVSSKVALAAISKKLKAAAFDATHARGPQKK